MTSCQKSVASVTSTASIRSPSRDDSMPSPARSLREKMTPRRPLWAWLWLSCSARVLLPESMVPAKYVSVAMSGGQPDQRDGGLGVGARAVHADQLQRRRGLGAGVDDRDVAAHRGDDVADDRAEAVLDLAEPAGRDRLVAGADVGPLPQLGSPRREDGGRGAGLGVHVADARLAGDESDAVGQPRAGRHVQARGAA